MKIFRYVFIPLFLIVVIIFIIYAFNFHKDLSYVFIEMDANIELVLNRNEKVVDSKGLNEKGNALLFDLKIKGLKYKEALKELTKQVQHLGILNQYKKDNLIVVNVFTTDELLEDRLVDFTIIKLKEYLNDYNISCVLVSRDLEEDVKSEASKLNILSNKMMFIQKALKIDKDLIKADLVSMNYNKIQKKILKYINNIEIDNKRIEEVIEEMINNNNMYIEKYEEQLYMDSDLFVEEIEEDERIENIKELREKELLEIYDYYENLNEEFINKYNKGLVEIKNYAIIIENYEDFKSKLNSDN